jgi:hypothetical protein
MITTIRRLNNGATFYLPQHPGNAYRFLGNGQAEFTRHRLNNSWVGCRITVSPDQAVATDPSDPVPDTCLCCHRPAVEDDLCFMCNLTARAAEREADMSLL